MLAIHNNDYKNFHDISLFITVRLNKFPDFSKTCNTLQNSISYRNELDRLINKLNLIKNSVNAYKALQAIMSQKDRVINFLNLTDLKFSLLTETLPILITRLSVERATEQRIINDKITLIKQCQKRFSKKSLTKKVAKEVNSYFQLKLKELRKGKNPALQSYYHATEDNRFDAILQSRHLKQFNTFMGRGAYVSTNVESPNYGECAFALSADAVHSYSAKYFYGKCWEGRLRYDSTWIRVHHTIHLKRRNVAHVIVTDYSKKNNIKARIQNYNLDVPVITIAANNCIANLFDDVGCKYHFPKTWERLNPNDPMPPNVIEFGQVVA